LAIIGSVHHQTVCHPIFFPVHLLWSVNVEF
jgi:hypothetical protein